MGLLWNVLSLNIKKHHPFTCSQSPKQKKPQTTKTQKQQQKKPSSFQAVMFCIALFCYFTVSVSFFLSSALQLSYAENFNF